MAVISEILRRFRFGNPEIERQPREAERNKIHRLFGKLSEVEIKGVQELLLCLESINEKSHIEFGVRYSLVGHILVDEIDLHTQERMPGGVEFTIVNDATADNTTLRHGAVDFLVLELNEYFLTEKGEKMFGIVKNWGRYVADLAEIDIGPDVFSFFISEADQNDSYTLAATSVPTRDVVLLNPQPVPSYF